MTGTKLVLAIPIIIIFLLTGTSARVFALSSQDRYDAGWSDGEQNAYDAWRLGLLVSKHINIKIVKHKISEIFAAAAMIL